MSVSRWAAVSVACVLLAAGLGAGLAAGFALYPWWFAKTDAPKEPQEKSEHVKLSPQARANLRLEVRILPAEPKQDWRTRELPARVKEYPRTLKLAAQVVEKEGNCDRLVSARLDGVITHIGAVRGDLVRPGNNLFTLDVVSEPLQTAQSAYYKNHLELDIVADEKRRLADALNSGALPLARKIELDNHWNKLTREREALEHELQVRGLTKTEIAGLAKGRFVTEIAVTVPEHHEEHGSKASGAASARRGKKVEKAEDFAYELEELKVRLGEQVKAGQALSLLGHHYRLQLEGRAFESERALIQQAAAKGWAIRAEFPHADSARWPADVADLKISFLESKVDAQQTLAFYLPLANQFENYKRGGKEYRLWRFRPGQRADLHIPVEKFEDVIVFPADAVVREGPDAYVFREDGSFFERKPVTVLFADRRVAVLANDGSILPGYAFAMNAAAQLNWALRTQSAGKEEGHHHDHHHH